jgi:isoquinoline 1-oxidoreductase beta subunit
MMGKWTRRAFITGGVAAGGVVVFGVAIRRGDRSDKVRGLIAAESESLFDVWLKIAPDNTITAIIPHADMGQGVHTALAMMLADELDADWSTVRFEEAPAHKEFANYSLAREYSAPDADFPAWLIDSVDGLFFRATQMMGVQITGGSLSVRTTGQIAMRVTGAATRAVLLEAAADAWQVPVSELAAGDSMIRHAASGREATFADFAPAAAALPLPAKPSLKSTNEFRIMGTSPPRFDVPAKVDGSANFGIDAVLPGMKHAAVKAAPVFGGRVLTVDESSIEALPGVRKVVDLGDAVAVIADGYWQAQKALGSLAVEFSDGGNGATAQDSIFEQFANELDAAAAAGREKTDFVSGNATAGLEAAARVLEAEYRVPFLAHAAMEPMNCTAWVHDDRCELWLGTQNPLGFAQQVAKAIGMDQSQVVLHNQHLGGGFGRRAFEDFAIQAARIAADSPYPVKLIWSREEDVRHDHYRQASISRFRGGLDASGRAIAWHNHYVNKHDPEEAPHIPYAIADQAIVYSESETHVPWGIWRSVDHSLHAFFTESFIDELAVAAGEIGLGRQPAREHGSWHRHPPLLRNHRRAGRRCRDRRRQAARAARSVRRGSRLRRASGQPRRTDGKRHRLRPDRRALWRNLHQRRRGSAIEFSRLPDAAHARGSRRRNLYHRRRRAAGRRRGARYAPCCAGIHQRNFRCNRHSHSRVAGQQTRTAYERY